MLGKDLKLSLSSWLTSARVQLIFPPHSPHRFFFAKDFFFFPVSSLSVAHAVPSGDLWFMPFVLGKKHSRTDVCKLDVCAKLGVLLTHLFLNLILLHSLGLDFLLCKKEETRPLF